MSGAIEATSKRAGRSLARALNDRDARLAAGGIAAAGAAIAGGAAALVKRRDGDSSEPARGYRIEDGQDPADGLRRIAAGRLDDALEQLRGEGEGEIAAAVHQTRKDLKKTRSVLRLVRDRIGDGVYRRENDRFRDVARLLSSARDAQVKAETLAALAERYPEDAPAQGWASYSGALASEAEVDPDPARIERAREGIVAGRAEVQAWPLGGEGWGLVGDGVARSYRRGRKRFAEVREGPSDEVVHEWRKRVKDLWYHLRLLQNTWPPVLGATADEAHELADLLGDHHDLAVLREDACSRAHLLGEKELESLTELIERRQGELLEDAIELGERVYVETPKRFTRRLESFWLAWR